MEQRWRQTQLLPLQVLLCECMHMNQTADRDKKTMLQTSFFVMLMGTVTGLGTLAARLLNAASNSCDSSGRQLSVKKLMQIMHELAPSRFQFSITADLHGWCCTRPSKLCMQQHDAVPNDTSGGALLALPFHASQHDAMLWIHQVGFCLALPTHFPQHEAALWTHQVG